LAELQKRGYECTGIEVDGKVAEWIHRIMNVDIRVGLFPCVDVPNCNLFLALDVLEHSPSPKDFLCEVSRLLNLVALLLFKLQLIDMNTILLLVEV
jgi:hypothetical protein